MSEMASLRVNPVPNKAPLVAPVTVISLAARPAGSRLKVSVNSVVVTDPDAPLAASSVKVTEIVPALLLMAELLLVPALLLITELLDAAALLLETALLLPTAGASSSPQATRPNAKSIIAPAIINEFFIISSILCMGFNGDTTSEPSSIEYSIHQK